MTEGERPSAAVLPTVADVVALPVVHYGVPEVLAGGDHLQRRVRWVHVSELADIGSLLRGGELILTTGIALPEGDDELRAYVRQLVDAGVSGLVIELGRRYQRLPRPLVKTAQQHCLPLVALHREVKFVKITEAVHSLIVAEQFEAMRLSEQAHEVFTSLSVRGARPDEIVREVARMAGCPAVFENLLHEVLTYDAAGIPADDLLYDWEPRSRAAVPARAGEDGWLITSVEARGQVWGRLILLPMGEIQSLQIMVAERGAIALTLNRLLEGNHETLERQAHRGTLSDLIEQRHDSDQEMHARTAALGVPTARRELIAVLVDFPAQGGQSRETEANIVSAVTRQAGLAALVAPLREGRVAVLVAVTPGTKRHAVLQPLAERIRERCADAVVAAGSTVDEMDRVRRSFTEAEQVAQAATGSPDAKAYYELPDVRLRGLLYTLGDDPRLQAFIERTVGALLDHDSRHATDLVPVLKIVLTHGGNKSAAAADAHLSRQALYSRIATIERILGVSLESAEVRTTLHAAVMALDSPRHDK